MNQTDHTEIRQTALQGGYTDALTAPMSLMVTQREFWDAIVPYASLQAYSIFWSINYDSGMEKAMEYLNKLVKKI